MASLAERIAARRESRPPPAAMAAASPTGPSLADRIARRRGAAPATGTAPYSEGVTAAGIAQNVGESGKRYVSDIARVFTHPGETAAGLAQVGREVESSIRPVEKLGAELRGEQYEAPETPALSALATHFGDRYGSAESVARTAYEDPVGFLADLSVVVTGGAGVAARAPGVAGMAGRVAGAVGRTLEPTQLIANAAKLGGKALGSTGAAALGWTTGAKSEAIRQAARTGYQGGDMAELFRGAMRGTVPLEDVVVQARGAVAEMYRRRSAAYTENMATVRAEVKPLSFKAIDDAITKAGRIKTFKGKDLSPTTAGVREQMREIIDEWRALPPGEYHTPAGMDALKQVIGDIQQGTKYGTPERKATDAVYNAIKGEIVKQAPEYAKAMRDYSEATEHLREIEGALSLGKKARTETALRKLQAIIRNDVSSAYGHRGNLADTLEDAGAVGLREQLAGHALSSPTPRGMATVATPMTIVGSSLMQPGALALAPLASPRLVGEGVHAGARVAGAAARGAGRVPVSPGGVASPAFQAGRAGEVVAGGAPGGSTGIEDDPNDAMLAQAPQGARRRDADGSVWVPVEGGWRQWQEESE